MKNISKDCDGAPGDAPLVFKDMFFSYSDKYIKQNQMLYSRELSLSCFNETDKGVLVAPDLFNVDDANNFLTFFKDCCEISPGGVLLDLPKPNIDSKRCYCAAKIVNISIATSVNSHTAYPNPRKLFSPYCRNTERSKPKATLDLDEIIPVLDESGSFNENFRGVSRNGYVNDGDILVLDPLLLEVMPRQRAKAPLTEFEQNKIARITITYVLAFFALVLTTFFIIYLA